MKNILFFFCLGVNVLMAQQTGCVDFKTASVKVSFVPDSAKVIGSVVYKLEILKAVDSVYLDAINMDFSNVAINGKAVSYSNNGKQIWIKKHFKPGKTYKLGFNYSAKPKKALYFIDWRNTNSKFSSQTSSSDFKVERRQVWTQGQGKYTSNWLPSIDDMNDKIEFDLSVTFKKTYQVVVNGKLIDRQVGDSTVTWHYDMQNPMPSYLVALAIGRYDKKTEYSKSGIPLEMYYYPEDSLKVEPTYRYTKQMFDFLEEEIGVPYPWQNYKQVPVKDFLYAGMENTGCTIFSDAFVVDSIGFVDKNYVNINAHELAHQWFGNLVTETSGAHHWLQEGFATYYALLAEREVFGDQYYYWRLYEYAQELIEQDRAGGGTSLLNPKSSSVTFYKRGAWVLHMLKEKVGHKAFKKAVKSYLLKYRFKNVKTHDFISEVEKASRENLKEFVKTWLEAKEFNDSLALGSLKQSVFIQEYLMVDCEVFSSKCVEYLDSGISEEAKRKIIFQNPDIVKKEHFNSSVKVRQAIAQGLYKIPQELKLDYESLLNDKSYVTVETALFNLWNNFPQERGKYLEKTKNIQGFRDKNVRMLWLVLALLTEDFEPQNQARYFKELTAYASSVYGFETRMNAFRYLTQIQACNVSCREHLKEATKHHNWRFVKFAKELLGNQEAR